MMGEINLRNIQCANARMFRRLMMVKVVNDFGLCSWLVVTVGEYALARKCPRVARCLSVLALALCLPATTISFTQLWLIVFSLKTYVDQA